MRLEAPVAVTRGDRFVLARFPPVTIGGGQVLDPRPAASGRSDSRRGRFDRSPPPAPRPTKPAIIRIIEDTGATGLPLETLVPRAGLAPAEVMAVAARLQSGGRVQLAGDRLVSTALLQDRRRLLALVADFHRTQPLADGVPREEARERLFARAHPHVFERVLQDLARANQLVVRDRLAAPGYRLELTPEEMRKRGRRSRPRTRPPA